MFKQQLFLILFAFCCLASVQGRRKGNVKCNNDEKIISIIHFCDDVMHCNDESDEITEHSLEQDFVSCNNAQNTANKTCMTKRENVCNDIVICRENYTKCDVHCEGYYRCQDTGKCVPRSTLCDGNSCNGCPKEDHGWTNGIGFKCRRNVKECILPQQLLWDGVADCDGGIDLCYEPAITPMYNASDFRQLNNSRFVPSRCFQCLHDVTIIPRSRVCDGVIDCPDMSDECLCTEKAPQICKNIFSRVQQIEGQDDITNARNDGCRFGQVKCYNGSCIPRSNVCDGKVQCSFAEDESYLHCDGTKPCFLATNEDSYCRCRYHSLFCRNTIALPCDGHDECLCRRGIRLTGEDEYNSRCWAKSSFNARRSSPGMSSTDREHPGERRPCDLPHHSYPESCGVIHPNGTQSNLTLNDEIVCDGYVDCIPFEEDELNCPSRFRCSAKWGAMVSVLRTVTCNGIVDCDNGEDESIEMCNETRFFCQSRELVSISKRFVCDGLITCDNSDDEKNCYDGRYYCENEIPLFVDGNKLFDERVDCSDWSDECPSNTSLRQPDIFHSKYDMIGNAFLRVLVWIMGFLALFGNMAVITDILTQQIKERKKNVTATLKANRLFVLNLAFADILMAFYLLGIGISGLTMKGEYCLRDLEWRSGLTCTVFGVLSVLSSETSVATMILLAVSRLYGATKPFVSLSSPKLPMVIVGIILSWIFSFSLALFPLAPSLEGYFIDQVALPKNPFSRKLTVNISDARLLAENALEYDQALNASLTDIAESLRSVNTASWSDLNKIFEDYTVHSDYYSFYRYFGYYSSNSVCVPKFFVTTSDSAWEFSIFVASINFISFLFVAASYTWIMVIKVSGNENVRASGSNDINKRIQRRILRLIITDFCCWVPISVITLCKIFGAYVGDTAYAVAAIVLLPINSALNPILYSNASDKVQSFLVDNFTKINRRHFSSESASENNVPSRTQSTVI